MVRREERGKPGCQMFKDAQDILGTGKNREKTHEIRFFFCDPVFLREA
jgi:hypothetical protein